MIDGMGKQKLPLRSMVKCFVYDCKWPYTTQIRLFTTVFYHHVQLSITIVNCHHSLTVVNTRIQRNTEQKLEWYANQVYKHHKWSYFSPYIVVLLRIRVGIQDCNAKPDLLLYCSIYDNLRLNLFDISTVGFFFTHNSCQMRQLLYVDYTQLKNFDVCSNFFKTL